MNKLTKVLVGGAVLISTVGAGVYVKHIYDTQHTISRFLFIFNHLYQFCACLSFFSAQDTKTAYES